MEEKKEKWYFKTHAFIIVLLCVGPFALPLLWFNPRFNLKTKILVSVIVIILTCYLTAWTGKSLNTIMEYYGQLKSVQ